MPSKIKPGASIIVSDLSEEFSSSGVFRWALIVIRFPFVPSSAVTCTVILLSPSIKGQVNLVLSLESAAIAELLHFTLTFAF